MRKLVLYGILIQFLLFFQVTSPLKAQEPIFSKVRSALKAGSAKELAKYFNETITLNINGEDSNYSSAHAEIYLKDFFRKYEPIDFEYAHQGSSNEGLKYAIGNYTFSGGSFRVLIRVKKFSGSEKIYILDFLKE